ncbi:MAG: alpha-L-fucosidase [Methylacidiphilales bacterium]|nr:alpha-L-fucosidase [Candidatus Methylacidiphilales bacterium]
MNLPQRQVHLDFHTSPWIPDVASEFDAQEFARTFRKANVDSVTIFAKCHHGMSYYPTKVGTMHPALKGRDLMGEMIEALHREGIRCPIYTTVGWEEDAAHRFPAWRQLRKDGTFASVNAGGKAPGPWKFLNFLHSDYQDYIEAHVREILSGYEVDGLFFDILFFAEDACWSDEALAFRRQYGFLNSDPETQVKFESAAQAVFSNRFSTLIRGLNPQATIFYNSSNRPFVDSAYGARRRLPACSHFEIESLPSGFWGYQHFPRLARLVSRWGVPWVGQTGRFQKMWGDFGGIKPQAALEYECFRAQALGGGNSVGDQLPPRGKLDPAAYQLIGAVYVQCAAAESFYQGSEPLPQVGIICPHYPGQDETISGKSEEGLVQMCEETHYESVILDDAGNLADLDLLILPDSVVITPKLKPVLASYHQKGGRLILSHRSGFDAEGKWALDFLPLSFAGATDKYPTYWRARAAFDPVLSVSDRVFYQQGLNVIAGKDTEVLVDRIPPYFMRTDLHFSSHFQTPPVADPDRYPAVVAGDRFVYFADPIFREYRQAGNLAARDGWKRAMERLIGVAPFGTGLPTTVLSVPRRRGTDLILTLLHYIPLRKALDIDVIEERMNFAGQILHLPPSAKRVRVFGQKETLPVAPSGGYQLPPSPGRLLLEISGFFQA